MAHCIVCGKRTKRVKFPFGTIALCYDYHCRNALIWKLMHGLPLVWVSPQDIIEHDIYPETPEGNAAVEELKNVNAETWDKLTDIMQDCLWNGDAFGQDFNVILRYGAQSLEHARIKATKKEHLPLLVGRIIFPENQRFLEERIKTNE